MRIILADNHGPVLGKEQTSANLSLLYLGAFLKEKASFEIELEYIPQARSAQYHMDLIKSYKAEIYAVSFTSYSALVTYELINKIKKEFPKIIIVCGGPHATHVPKEVLELTKTDICVIGEGEETFFEIVTNLHQIDVVKNKINGIAYINNGSFVQTPTRAVIDNIDSIPFPLRNLVNDDDFRGLSYSKARPNTEMVVTRGCPLRCVFCANPVFRLDNGPLFRSRSPENIVKEIKELYQLGYKEIFFHSDEFNVKLDWTINVCKAIVSLGYNDLYFQANMRVVPMSEELAYWMKKANFWLVRIGIESTSDRVLKGVRKRVPFEKTEIACKLLTNQGIKVYGFTMLFNYWEENGALQHESIEEVKKTIKDMYILWRKGHLNYTSWAFAIPVHGSEFYDIALRHGLIDKDYYPDDNWETFNYLKGVSKKEFNKVYAAARRQQAIMALTSGNFEWRNYKAIIRKAWTMLKGKPD